MQQFPGTGYRLSDTSNSQVTGKNPEVKPGPPNVAPLTSADKALLDFMKARHAPSNPNIHLTPIQPPLKIPHSPLKSNPAVPLYPPVQAFNPLQISNAAPKYVSDSTMFNQGPADNLLMSSIPRGLIETGKIDLSSLSEGQKKAVMAIVEGKNILLTGPAGTGKSHTIKKISEIYKMSNLNISVTSTTGASAILIEGKTIHAWSGIGIAGTKEGALKQVQTYKAPQERIKAAHLLIIDEISMFSGYHLDILDHVFRHIRVVDKPFGGIQVVLCGDFFQLKPVKSDKYAFESESWPCLIHEVHELTQIFRQDNLEFCKALNEIRVGEVSPTSAALVESCIGRQFNGDIKPTVLYAVNADVSELNEAELWKLASPTNPVKEICALDELIEKPRPRGNYKPEFIESCKKRMNKDCIAQERLLLCVGAQVMLIKNINVDAGLANGSRGVVVRFNPQGMPVVKFMAGHEVELGTHTWYLRINETIKMKRTQIPLAIAYSVTTHKSQGMTLDCVRMDLGTKLFCEGQFYTAISRARSLEGLSIIALDWNSLYVDKKVKDFYAKHRK